MENVIKISDTDNVIHYVKPEEVIYVKPVGYGIYEVLTHYESFTTREQEKLFEAGH